MDYLDYFKKGAIEMHNQQDGKKALVAIVKDGDDVMVELEGNGMHILNCLIGAACADSKLAMMMSMASDTAQNHFNEIRNEMKVRTVRHEESPMKKEEQA